MITEQMEINNIYRKGGSLASGTAEQKGQGGEMKIYKCNHGVRTVDLSKYKNSCMKCELGRDIIAEVAELYYKRSGIYLNYPFWVWLYEMDIDTTKSALLDILNNPDKYFQKK